MDIVKKYFPEGKGIQVAQAHGVLVLDKPSGPTSARCLSVIKRLGQKKIGHAGTLDPMASGVLLVLLGQATKISGHLMSDGAKVYKGCLRLGQQTDTWDAEGSIVNESPWQHITEDMVKDAILAWQGKHEQEVPPYSAAKHEGKPLYKLARLGKETPKKIKSIEILHVEVLEMALPYAYFRVECSSGTYIRSLAHSLGTRLGCGAVLTELTREFSYPFGLENAHNLDAICKDPMSLQEMVMPITAALPHWPLLELTKPEQAQVMNGMPVAFRPATPQNMAQEGIATDKAILMGENNSPLALATASEVQGKLHWTVLRGLWN